MATVSDEQMKKSDGWGRPPSTVWLAIAIGLAGCGGTSTSASADIPDECLGNYTGSFSGDSNGTLTGSLDADAEFTVTFLQTSTNQSASGSGNIQENGAIEIVLGPNRVTGTFRFAQCRASGQWATGATNGSWSASKR